MSEHFGDERSISVRGEMRAIEILLLDEITPFVTDDDLTETMSEIRRLLEQKAERLKQRRQEQQVLVPHATRPNRKNSYVAVPLQVARACGEAIERHRRQRSSSTADLSTQVNKRSHVETEKESRN